MIFIRLYCVILLLTLFSCAIPFKQIKDSSKPFKRPSYSILPPKEVDWYYSDNFHPFNRENQLVFAKEFDSSNHLLNLLS